MKLAELIQLYQQSGRTAFEWAVSHAANINPEEQRQLISNWLVSDTPDDAVALVLFATLLELLVAPASPAQLQPLASADLVRGPQ
jgi:hypothetical protein